MTCENPICVKKLRPGDRLPATAITYVIPGYRSEKIVTVACPQGSIAQCVCGPRKGDTFADSVYLINQVSVVHDECVACDGESADTTIVL